MVDVRNTKLDFIHFFATRSCCGVVARTPKQNPQMLKFKIGDFVVKKQDAVIPENEPGAAG
ncbi:MAG: hypothetical protein V7K72_05370, partial [Nostoc sp.]|uniref:hypothetical protein n=1 Tax=Nostoc sp. TaxID=1180 RepID=UPI002FF9C974